jgi:nucleoside-diphosphate-sugar epimerase
MVNFLVNAAVTLCEAVRATSIPIDTRTIALQSITVKLHNLNGAIDAMSEITVLVTGANGFVGRHVAAFLAHKNCQLILAVRNDKDFPQNAGSRLVPVGDISGTTHWARAVDGVTVIVHTAGMAHHTGAMKPDESEYFRVNVDGIGSLSRAAQTAAVPVFINLSSVAVYDPSCGQNAPATELSPCAPQTAYGKSKLEAEGVAASLVSAITSVIQLRAPLIFGSGARGNWPRFESLASGPLPVPSIAPRNRRSVLGIQNLCDAIWCAVQCGTVGHSKSGVFNLADNGFVSTDDLIRCIRKRNRRLLGIVPYTSAAIRVAARTAGKEEMFAKMANNLMIDNSKFCAKFGWQPPHTTFDALLKG